jgi:predicted Mrr-cat superfamily restriction endonuclease
MKRKDSKKLYIRPNPNNKKMRIIRMVGQIWDFAREIKKGDLVALPLKSQSTIA